MAKRTFKAKSRKKIAAVSMSNGSRWASDSHSVVEQRVFVDGRRIVTGKKTQWVKNKFIKYKIPSLGLDPINGVFPSTPSSMVHKTTLTGADMPIRLIFRGL